MGGVAHRLLCRNCIYLGVRGKLKGFPFPKCWEGTVREKGFGKLTKGLWAFPTLVWGLAQYLGTLRLSKSTSSPLLSLGLVLGTRIRLETLSRSRPGTSTEPRRVSTCLRSPGHRDGGHLPLAPADASCGCPLLGQLQQPHWGARTGHAIAEAEMPSLEPPSANKLLAN